MGSLETLVIDQRCLLVVGPKEFERPSAPRFLAFARHGAMPYATQVAKPERLWRRHANANAMTVLLR